MARWLELRSLVEIGLLAAVMLRVCLGGGVGSGVALAALGAVGVSVVTLLPVLGAAGVSAALLLPVLGAVGVSNCRQYWCTMCVQQCGSVTDE